MAAANVSNAEYGHCYWRSAKHDDCLQGRPAWSTLSKIRAGYQGTHHVVEGGVISELWYDEISMPRHSGTACPSAARYLLCGVWSAGTVSALGAVCSPTGKQVDNAASMHEML